MKIRLLIIIAITILVAMYFLMHARIWPEPEPCDVGFEHYHFGYCGSNSFTIPTALANTQIMSEESNPKFIGFSYMHKVGYPIQFIIEKPSDRNCNSYDAKITNDEGNFVLGWGVDISCDPAIVLNPVQTKIGYNENKPIIINESGKYYLEVEFIDAFIKQEFVVRQNHWGVNIDDTDYSNVREFLPPLKQIKSDIATDKIRCNEGLVLMKKYDGSPSCVKKKNFEKLIQRNWGQQISYNNLVMTDSPSEVYLPGMPISFKVTETGWGNPCNSMLLSITNLDTDEIVWSRSEIHPCFSNPKDDFFTHVSYVPDSRVLELSFEGIGNYQLKIESRHETLEHSFSIKRAE